MYKTDENGRITLTFDPGRYPPGATVNADGTISPEPQTVIPLDRFIDRFAPDEYDRLLQEIDQRSAFGKSFRKEWDRLSNRPAKTINLASERWVDMGQALRDSGVVETDARLAEILAEAV